jgi:hypothetical protein
VLLDTVGTGGLELGGVAPVTFTHGSDQADADIVVEWDLDGDGDFDLDGEDVTAYLLDGESMTGRDFPSQLTGRAGPGKAKFELLNTDGRFSYFNEASPLNTPPLSVRAGGRIRVRTADADNPDPVLLARDRFRGEGALGTDELGLPWVDQTAPITFTRGGGVAEHSGPKDLTASVAVATVDVGVDDCFAQLRVRHRDGTSNAAIVYRFDNTSNYGLVYLAAGFLVLAENVAGVITTTASVLAENRTDVTIGVHVAGATAVVYLEGVPVITDDAYSSSSTLVGIRGNWRQQRAVSVDEFYVWDAPPAAEVEGILWTGKVTTVTPHAPLGAPATVTVTAEGPLLDAARVEVDPPASVGDVSSGPGMTTGLLVGATLSAAGLLQPPGPIAAGDITTGAVGLKAGKALELARLFEEVELGFLYETQEGRLGYAARNDRVGGTPVVTFSDHLGAQFGYARLELGDWRREVFNRVKGRLAPGLAGFHAGFGSSLNVAGGVDASVTFALPDAGNDAVVGDLFIVVIAATVGSPGLEWLTPIGWKSYRDAKDFIGRLRIYAKVVEEGDLGATVTFYDDVPNAGGSYIHRLWLIKNWYGDLDQGVVVAEPHGLGQPNTVAQARNGENNPPAIFPGWGPAPSLLFSVRAGMTSASGATVAAVTDDDAPNGYGNASSTFVNGVTDGSDVAFQYAVREACVAVEAPSMWAIGAATFGGFEFVETVTVAVRGFAGDPPEPSGGQVVQLDDFASQDAYDAILTHEAAAELFADTADATAYGEAVLLRHRGERPIFTLTFPATLNAAYRAQAMRRRVNHLIMLEADGDTGMGVTGEFYIEQITHRWTDAGKQWWVTWQLSPA